MDHTKTRVHICAYILVHRTAVHFVIGSPVTEQLVAVHTKKKMHISGWL